MNYYRRTTINQAVNGDFCATFGKNLFLFVVFLNKKAMLSQGNRAMPL